MFLFIIKYFGFLKFVPGLAILFDNGLKLYSLLTKPNILDCVDEIEATLLQWPHTSVTTHKYGGIQFNYEGKEIGHIHSNGLLDMLLSRKLKARWMQDGRIQDHHSFKNSGWISFYISTIEDKEYAIQLLQAGYEKVMQSDMK
ncbi:luciferase domain-containing protein [Mucilaginibacter lacusdianchii]|uniref:luciferase domain-containing protein n=1 Tax=Mucilaginibacter lacusdianchii TaxID=2684211 RepID=UPI001E4A0E2D|nr:luciferase family protein [Mucilaginibacter sp. JXJ CY 39]